MTGLLFWIVAAAGEPPSSPDQPSFLLSVPLSSTEPRKATALVEFTADVFGLRECKVVESSGDSAADQQACKTVTFWRASSPKRTYAPVWISDRSVSDFQPARIDSKTRVPPWIYPELSASQKQQGTVVLKLTVNEAAKVTKCVVASSSGWRALDSAAKLGFCRSLKLEPATLNSTAVASINFLKVTFYLGLS
jgi:TonB family protein